MYKRQPFRDAEFDIIFGEGISREGSLLDVGVAHNILTRTGTWYSYGDIRLGQGKEAARQYFRDHPETSEEVASKIRALLNPKDADSSKAPKPGAGDAK